ncbi:MAG: endonuclease/exonuclease/phosphatase family protein [Lachnospiraceae bacterium]|jgi:endonuclease/exonuclease/phosphatase family metal-dependent hydrolase|nr:endonuclease/exonuclease/phosphatase family protein [Lachnospiraceae bacterium]
MFKKGKIWKIPLGILGTAALIVGGYVSYVLLTYSRIEDNVSIASEGNAELVAKPDEEYTIVSYNAGFGAYTADFTFFMDEGKESRARSAQSVKTCIDEIGDRALSFSPDLVLFQEIDTDSTRSYHINEADLLKEKFQSVGQFDNVFARNYHSAYLMYPLYKPHGASNSGLLTFSRFTVSSSLRRSLPIATDIKKVLDLDRCYCISRIPVENGKELVLINTHLSAYGTDAAQGNAQLEMLFADMKAEYEKGNYVICGGDFNHDFTTTSKEYFNPGTDKTYSWCHPFPDAIIPDGFSKCTDYAEGMVSSSRYTNIPYCEDSFTVILDGYIVSDNVSCEYVQNIDTGYEYTDHNPVVMKFRLN